MPLILFYLGISKGFLAGFFAMLVHAIGANTFIIVRIMEPFWFLTAIVVMIPLVADKEESQKTTSLGGNLVTGSAQQRS